MFALRNSQCNLNWKLNDVKPGQWGSCCELQTQETSCVGAAKCLSLSVVLRNDYALEMFWAGQWRWVWGLVFSFVRLLLTIVAFGNGVRLKSGVLLKSVSPIYLFFSFSSLLRAVVRLHSSLTLVASLHFHDYCLMISNPGPFGVTPAPPRVAPARQDDLHRQQSLVGGWTV